MKLKFSINYVSINCNGLNAPMFTWKSLVILYQANQSLVLLSVVFSVVVPVVVPVVLSAVVVVAVLVVVLDVLLAVQTNSVFFCSSPP